MSLSKLLAYIQGEDESHMYQFCRGQDILVDVDLHVSKALQGHLMYFFPGGGGLIGYGENKFCSIFLHHSKYS